MLHKISHSFAVNEWDDPESAVLRIALEQWGKGTMRPGCRREHYTLFLVRAGSLSWDAEDMLLQPGDALLCRPDERRLISVPEQPVQLGICLFQGSGWVDVLEKAFPNGQNVVSQSDSMGEIFPIYDSLLEEALRARTDSHEACRHWLNLLLLRIARQPGVAPVKRARSWLKYQAARQLISEEWRTLGSINEVARRLDISHTYLCRIFKDYEASTPQNFLMNLRIRASADELARGERSLAELARSYQFADQFAFSRAFKRIMSEPPSHYAARYQMQER